MEEQLTSSSWYRVAETKPRLKSHAQIHRHIYRGRDWYVLQDHSSGRFHRFSPEAYLIIGLMDGGRSLGEIWRAACLRLGDDMPTQDEVIRLLSQLYRADVLQTDVTPDIAELLDRQVKTRRTKLLSYVRSPVALRLPLLDPNRFLTRTRRMGRMLFGPLGAVAWLLVVVPALVQVGIHWEALTENIIDRALSLQNLLAIALIYPIVKGLHEFGHGYAVKRWGGEVHEMGMMLLVFVPIPYVDASAATAFRQRYQRVLVGAAGILVEMFLAGLAVFVWTSVEPGGMRATAYNVMLIAGVSTLLFNGNPLLRFDAYYILSDLLEIPNLGSRGTAYLSHVLQVRVLGVEGLSPPEMSEGEKGWLVIYAVASLIYRTFVIVAIILIAASKFLGLGLVIAAWAAVGILWQPLSKAAKFLSSNAQARRRRGRIAAVSGGFALLLGLLVGAVPFPLFTVAEGVVWEPERSRVRAESSGFVVRLEALPGSRVRSGDVLIVCENPELSTRTRVLASRLGEYEARHRAAFMANLTEAEILREEVERVRAELARAREREDGLKLRAEAEGLFLIREPENLPGSFLVKGTDLGFVADFLHVSARVVVDQSAVSRVRRDTRGVEARLAGRLDRLVPARLVREVPAASTDLPSPALSLQGGGDYAVDPRVQGASPQAFEPLFQFDVELTEGVSGRVGERVHVRFEHPPEPLMFRWYRGARRLLLNQFDV